MGYKINKLTSAYKDGDDTSNDPTLINYKTSINTRLHPSQTFVKGRLIRVDYYLEYDGEIYSDLIMTVDIDYTDNPDGSAQKRVTTRCWILEDDSVGEHKKITTKYYDTKMSSAEGHRRRINIIDGLIDSAHLFNATEEFKVMFRDIDLDINAYEKTGDQSIINSIMNYKVSEPEAAWLESTELTAPYTVRQAIVGALQI